jgi:hypothetical protein
MPRITTTQAGLQIAGTPCQQLLTSSMSAQHQSLDRQQQRLDAQQHGVHNAGGGGTHLPTKSRERVETVDDPA